MLSIREALLRADTLPKQHLGLTLTESCSVGCRHCAPECIPKQDDALGLVKELRGYLSKTNKNDYPSLVVVSGGEPFDRLIALQKLSKDLEELEIPLQAHTSANWANKRKGINKILSELPSLEKITISTDQYHQEKVTFNNINLLIDCCRDKSIPVSLAVRLWDIEKDPFWQKLNNSIPDELLNYCTFDIHSIILGGRASYDLAQEEEAKRGKSLDASRHYKIKETTTIKSDTYNWKETSIPCEQCQRPIIRKDGLITACCNERAASTCEKLIVGSIYSDNNLRDINNKVYEDAEFSIIKRKGPLALLKQQDVFIQSLVFEQVSKLYADNQSTNINCFICTNTLLLADLLKNQSNPKNQK